jgi:hypothetical protein
MRRGTPDELARIKERGENPGAQGSIHADECERACVHTARLGQIYSSRSDDSSGVGSKAESLGLELTCTQPSLGDLGTVLQNLGDHKGAARKP